MKKKTLKVNRECKLTLGWENIEKIQLLHHTNVNQSARRKPLFYSMI